MLKIDSILHYVTDLQKSNDFYQNVLHLTKVWEDTDRGMIGYLFPENNSELVIHTNKNLPNPSYSFSVENVFDFCSEYKKKGYNIIVEPFEVRTGYYAILSDLDNNEFGIIDLSKFDNKPRYDI